LKDGSRDAFLRRFPGNRTTPPGQCFLGKGKEQEAIEVIANSGQTVDAWRTTDTEHNNREVFIKKTLVENNTTADIMRELDISAKMVHQRTHIESRSHSSGAFEHLSLPLAACEDGDGSFLIASPLLFDEGGHVAEDLMTALLDTSENGASSTWQELNNARSDERKLRDLIKPLFTAVHIMHILNVAHRDIKPENILIIPNSKKLVLIDFGHGTHVRLPGPRKQSAARGTEGWVPWQIHQNAQCKVDPLKCDVFALAQIVMAILFYTLITVELNGEGDRDDCGVPTDEHRENMGLQPLSPNLRHLLGSMLIQADDEKRISVRGALDHPWFTNDDPRAPEEGDAAADLTRSGSVDDVVASPRSGTSLDRRTSSSTSVKRANSEYQTAVTSGWHVMTAHAPARLIQEYPVTDAMFPKQFDVTEPVELSDRCITRNTQIRPETLSRARSYQMKYYYTVGANPYLCVDSDVLNALQKEFPDAVPLPNVRNDTSEELGQHESGPDAKSRCLKRAPQKKLTDFITKKSQERDVHVKRAISMYTKQGAFARQITPDTPDTMCDQKNETTEDDNPFCFCFEAPWDHNDTDGKNLGPATCEVALGDYLGLKLDVEKPHVWKISRNYFVGEQKMFKKEEQEEPEQEVQRATIPTTQRERPECEIKRRKTG